MSLSLQQPGEKPLPVVRWTAAQWQQIEAARDKIMRGVGTDEPWHQELGPPVFADYSISVQFRRPLRIDEVNLMKPTRAVRERKGRP